MSEKPVRPKAAKMSREERLAQNLRANLRRRKQATRKIGGKVPSSDEDG